MPVWEHAKARFSALVLAALFGLIGFLGLTTALVIAVEPNLGWIGALCLVGGALVMIAIALAFYGLHPEKTLVEDAVDTGTDAVDDTTGAFIKLVRDAVEQRPAAMVALALALGYGVGTRPEEATRLATQIREWLE